MSDKSIEIYYDIATIPGLTGRRNDATKALDFRNAAMEHIEQALAEAGAGEWQGAEIGSGEVNFGFDVEDFAQAEQIVRASVAGTPYENIREIVRHEWSEEEMANLSMQQGEAIKPMNFFELIGMLIFRRMPKRFRS